mgnify:CR=1 FL=1
MSFRALLIYFFISIQLGLHSALHSQILKNNLESELIIEKFHINDGLKSIRIFDIYSDLNNIIWIVTESSLYSFNGFTFDEKVNFGALRFHPQRIYIDNNKNLWLIEPQFQTKTTFEATIAKELIDAQGKPNDIGGYYMPDANLVAKAMRPSKTLNSILDTI